MKCSIGTLSLVAGWSLVGRCPRVVATTCFTTSKTRIKFPHRKITPVLYCDHHRYILKCVEENKILPDLRAYKQASTYPTPFASYDPIDVLLGKVWAMKIYCQTIIESKGMLSNQY